MITYIYRCLRKTDTYLYTEEKDEFSKIPDEILKHLGTIEFSMEIDIQPDTKLAIEDPTVVLDNLRKNGFHLQLPSDTSTESILANIARQKLM